MSDTPAPKAPPVNSDDDRSSDRSTCLASGIRPEAAAGPSSAARGPTRRLARWRSRRAAGCRAGPRTKRFTPHRIAERAELLPALVNAAIWDGSLRGTYQLRPARIRQVRNGPRRGPNGPVRDRRSTELPDSCRASKPLKTRRGSSWHPPSRPCSQGSPSTSRGRRCWNPAEVICIRGKVPDGSADPPRHVRRRGGTEERAGLSAMDALEVSQLMLIGCEKVDRLATIIRRRPSVGLTQAGRKGASRRAPAFRSEVAADAARMASLTDAGDWLSAPAQRRRRHGGQSRG